MMTDFSPLHSLNEDSLVFSVELPLTDYQEVLALQRGIVSARRAERLDADIILILEHPPVFTLGRNGGRENLMVAEAFLKRIGIRLVQIERGGNITYHGPGQLVVYPILDLNVARLGVKDYVAGLEQVMARTAGEWGLQASGHSQKRGVWIDDKKLGSIGITIRQGICFHGLALNVNVSLEPFNWINPCGLQNVRMTSMQYELGQTIPMKRIRERVKHHLSDFLGKKLVPLEPASLRDMIQINGHNKDSFRPLSVVSKRAI